MEELNLQQFDSVRHLSKNALHLAGQQDAEKLNSTGFNDAVEMAITARKAVEYLGAFMKALDSSVLDALYKNGEKQTLNVLGCELTVGSTGDRLDYEQDVVYKNLAIQLKQRADILKLARNSDVDIVDTNGEPVMKVGIKTPSKELIRVKL